MKTKIVQHSWFAFSRIDSQFVARSLPHGRPLVGVVTGDKDEAEGEILIAGDWATSWFLYKGAISPFFLSMDVVQFLKTVKQTSPFYSEIQNLPVCYFHVETKKISMVLTITPLAVQQFICDFPSTAHENIRLLIYHGGLNGGYEAMYYGVPILGIPLYTDQIDDLVRLKKIGMAHHFPRGIIGLTSEGLYQGIREVLDNPS